MPYLAIDCAVGSYFLASPKPRTNVRRRDELPYGYDVQYDDFRTKRDLHDKARNWLDGIDREARDTDLPVFITGDTYAPESEE